MAGLYQWDEAFKDVGEDGLRLRDYIGVDNQGKVGGGEVTRQERIRWVVAWIVNIVWPTKWSVTITKQLCD